MFGSLERAGAQLRTLEVCAELKRRYAIDFELCSIGLGPDELGDEVRRRGGSTRVVSMRSPSFPLALSRVLRSGRFDVVNTEPQLLSGLIVSLAALHRVPTRIVTIHNTMGAPGQGASSPWVHRVLANRVFISAMRFLMTRFATHVVAVSQSALESVLPGQWRSRCDTRIVYNGTPTTSFEAVPERQGVRHEFGWPVDARIVINVGRFTMQKNHATMLRAMRSVLERDASARLLLVGGGALRGEVERSIDELGLRDACAVTGDRTDVPRLLLASDLFFFPSLWEGLPGAPLEALAAGLPVVAGDIPSIREIAPYFGGAITTATPTDAERLADHIVRALARPHDRAEAQRRFAATPFAMEFTVDAYRTLYGFEGPGEDVA